MKHRDSWDVEKFRISSWEQRLGEFERRLHLDRRAAHAWFNAMLEAVR